MVRRIRAISGVAAMAVTGALASSASAHDPAVLGPLDSLVPPSVIHLSTARIASVPGSPAVTGAFDSPFAEPTVGGVRTDAKCITRPVPNGGLNGATAELCKPAAGTLVQLPDGRLLFWDALEGTENNKYSIVTEGGQTFTNDAARVLTLGAGGAPSWINPSPVDGGANPNGNPGEPLIPGLSTTESYNDGALFGSHQSFLPDGRLLVQGGTDYSSDPGVNGIPFGAVELTGLKATRIFDPRTNAFTQTGDTAYRRWYPTLIETGQGHYLDLSGVGKLLKPVYPDHPQDSLTNVKQVEEFDPTTGRWRQLPSSADYDLPLYPRVHLLPDGHVFYNAAGQDFNPFGQSVGELNWNFLASLDPQTATWTNLGLANTATPTAPAFRGSTSSTLLPLTPDANGRYTKANLLTAGGVLGTSPGSYVTTAESSITTVDTGGGHETVSQQRTGPLGQGRWFGQNILLPTGQVVVFSGANKDEVVLPGTEMAIQQAELFDPTRNTWSPWPLGTTPGRTTTPPCCAPTAPCWWVATRRSPPRISTTPPSPAGSLPTMAATPPSRSTSRPTCSRAAGPSSSRRPTSWVTGARWTSGSPATPRRSAASRWCATRRSPTSSTLTSARSCCGSCAAARTRRPWRRPPTATSRPPVRTWCSSPAKDHRGSSPRWPPRCW